MAVAVTPRIVWHGSQPWAVIASTSALGDATTHIGPLANVAMLSAVSDRVQAIVAHAEGDLGRAIVARPSLCARCLRTLFRSALGDLDAAQAIMRPQQPADQARYAAAWPVVAQHVQAVQAAIRQLCAEAARGAVVNAEQSGAADYYTKDGAPMHVGLTPKWEDYKTCACGSPDDTSADATMMVGAVGAVDPAGAVAAVEAARPVDIVGPVSAEPLFDDRDG